MIGTLYNNIKSVSNWTKEYISSGEFKRVVFSVVTVGGYHYYFIDKQNDFREKQYILQKENLDAKIKHDEEMRRKEEEKKKKLGSETWNLNIFVS
jgi:alpha-acetolactate decarboxylase